MRPTTTLVAAFLCAAVAAYPQDTPPAQTVPPVAESPAPAEIPEAVAAEDEIVEIAIEREVVVTATKHEQSLWDAPSTIYVLDSRDIETSGARNLSDLLRQIPGMEVRTWLSEFQNLSMRGLLGASVVNERILWLLDGMPWNDVRDGGVWGGDELPLELVERVEVQVGPGSTLYGANAFQGVIHIVTKGPAAFKEHQTQVKVRRGTFDTTRSSIATGRMDSTARRGFMVGASLNRSDGFGHLVRDEYALGRNPAYPHGAAYEPNSERTWGYLHGRLQYDAFALSAGIRDVRLGYAGAYFAPFKTYDWKRGELWVDGSFKRDVGDRIELETLASYHDWTESFRNFSDIPVDASFTDPATGVREALPGTRYDVESHRWFFEQRVFFSSARTFCPAGDDCSDTTRLKPVNQLFVGGGLRSESYDGNDFYSNFEGQGFQSLDKTNLSLFAQNEYALADGRITLNAGLRFDTHPDYDNVVSPRAALVFAFLKGRGRLRLGYGSAYKEPANWQKYIDQPTGQGSPGLVPETLDMWEAAVSYRLARDLHARVNFFKARHDDIITEFFDPTIADPRYVQFGIFGKFHPQQLGYDADMQGVELELRGRFGGWTSGYVNYSYLDTVVKRDAGSLPPGAPLELPGEYDSQHRWNAGVTLTADDRFSLSAGVHYVGASTDTSLEFAPVDPSSASSPLIGIRPVPAYTIAEAAARVRAYKDVALTVGAWNLSAQVHEEMLGVPAPGPAFFVQVTFPY